MTETAPERCVYAPFGSYSCGQPVMVDHVCWKHRTERCDVCGGQATYACTGAVGSYYCARNMCDTCMCPSPHNDKHGVSSPPVPSPYPREVRFGPDDPPRTLA